MKLSTRSRYGLRLMLALALNQDKKPVYLKEIARSEEISEKYLSHIIISLRAKGLVSAFRGAHGGYVLGRPASQIKLLDIIGALEGELYLVDCIKKSDLCGRSAKCIARDVWDEMSGLLIDYLARPSLEDIIVKYRNKMEQEQNIVNYTI